MMVVAQAPTKLRQHIFSSEFHSTAVQPLPEVFRAPVDSPVMVINYSWSPFP